MKVNLNLGKKEKIGDHGVTLLNIQTTIKNLPKTSISPSTELLCLPYNQNIFNLVESLYIKTFRSWSNVYITKQPLQLFDQFIYLKVVSYINPNFPNIPSMVQNFQILFENFALVNMSKLVISQPNISKTDISYLLKITLSVVINFIFKVDWFTFIKTNSLELFENFEPS